LNPWRYFRPDFICQPLSIAVKKSVEPGGFERQVQAAAQGLPKACDADRRKQLAPVTRRRVCRRIKEIALAQWKTPSYPQIQMLKTR
jgi:hypothetical protein